MLFRSGQAVLGGGAHEGPVVDDLPVPDHHGRQIVPGVLLAISEARIDPEYMKDFLKTVNIESVIIKACELVDNLEHPTSRRESALLQDVLEAESFYAPLCEVLGLEALGSKLLGLAKRIRLEKLNKFASIEQARDMLFNIKTVGVRRILESISRREQSFGLVSSHCLGTQY